MFTQQHSPNRQALKQMNAITSNTNRLQFFSSLFTTNEITYLDPHKVYCIIQTERYTQIKQQLTASLENQQILQKKVYEADLANAGLNWELKSYRQQLQTMNQKQKVLVEQYQTLTQRCKDYERTLEQVQTKTRTFQNQRSIAENRTSQKTGERVEKSYSNSSCQTQAQTEIEEDINESAMQEEVRTVPQIDAAEQKLSELLQLEMEKFQQQFEQKLAVLEQSKHNIEKWEAQNQSLLQENQQLKQKIIDRDIEEEKLKIWKENISSFVSRVEGSIIQPTSKFMQIREEGDTSEEVHRLKEEVLELRGKVIEMRSKVKRIDELMEGEAEISDDGAIGLLVRLSQKMKNLVKGMLMQVEQV